MNGRRPDVLVDLGGDPAAVGLFLDFDGTLSEIAPTPEQARPFPGVALQLQRLAAAYGLVGVVTGRPSEDVRRVLSAPGVQVFGLYGAEGSRLPAVRPALRDAVVEAVRQVPGARVEDKGSSLAVHVRGTADPEAALALLGPLLEGAATDGEVVLAGRLVLEMAPRVMDDKGRVVIRAVHDRGLRGALYAGDDLADVAAFDALDRLRDEGVATVRVAVDSAEAPPELLGRADLVVEGPGDLLGVLRDLDRGTGSAG